MSGQSQPSLPATLQQQLEKLPAVAANIKELREFLKSSYDTGTGYGRAVVGLGYIGFFSLWAGTRSQVIAHFPKTVLWSAVLLGVSLFIYIGFEVAQSAIISFEYFAMLDRVEKQSLDIALFGFHVNMGKHRHSLFRVWRFIFIASTLFGFGGATILVVGWIRTILQT